MASIGKMFAAALLGALGKGTEEYGNTYKEFALKRLEELEPTTIVKTARQIDPDFESRPTEEKRKIIGQLNYGYPTGWKPEPQGPQPASALQEADAVANLEAIPEEKRTPQQKSKLKFLQNKNKKGGGFKLSEVGTKPISGTVQPNTQPVPPVKPYEQMTDEELDREMKSKGYK